MAAGKSTLLKVLNGSEITVDRGNVQRRSGLRVSDLAQQLPVADDTTVLDSVRQGVGRAIRVD